MLVVRVLGGFEMRLSDIPVRIPRRHVQQLLACLMLERGKSVSRDLLGGFFWPEDERKSQLSQLRNVLSRLRELLGKPDYIQQEKGFLAFNTALPYELDATPLLACEFLALNEKSTAELMQISENYHPFLPEFDETWVITQRSRLESIHDERVLRTIVERLLSERQWALLADWGRRAISRPGNQGFEPLYTHVMRAEYHLHNPKGVSDVYAALNAALDELGLVPFSVWLSLFNEAGPWGERRTPDRA